MSDYKSIEAVSVDLIFRLGPGRRDSAAQINAVSPPTETRETSPPPARRRRSSLAQLTDILREWGGGSGGKAGRGSKQAQLVRRETLADLARSLPWSRGPAELRKRRESSADSGVKSASGKSSAISDFRSDIARLLGSRRDSTVIVASPRRGSGESGRSGGRRDSTVSGSRRGSGESSRSHHHHHHHHHRSTRRRQEQQRPSTSSTASDAPPPVQETIQPPTIITSSPVSPIAVGSAPFPVVSSPTAPQPPTITSPQPPSASQALTTSAGTPTVTTTTTTQATTPGGAHPLLSTRRDSTTQVNNTVSAHPGHKH